LQRVGRIPERKEKGMAASSLLRRAVGVTVGLAAAGSVLVGGATASAATGPTEIVQIRASAKPQCKVVWNDANTAGIRCDGGKGSFVGWAKCKNGRVALGARAAYGTTSYAYCTSVYSSLKIPVESGYASKDQ
jgi:hypothetical protein